MADSSHPIFRPRRWLLVVVVATVIGLGSVVDPGTGIARAGPLGLTWTTWSHLAGYGLLTLSALYARLDSRLETAISTAVVPIAVIAFGVFIEFVQATLPYRTCAVGDMLTNAVGATVVTVVWLLGRHGLDMLGSRRS